MTALAFPAPHSAGSFHTDQDLGDLDGDGDLDVLGVNWNVAGVSVIESVLWSNGGNGIFGNPMGLQDLETDEHDADLIDFDNDGDLDAYMANWTGGVSDRLYRNDTAAGGPLQFAQEPIPSTWTYGSDADACDTDGDGDYDVLIAKEVLLPEVFLRNVTQQPDAWPPRVAPPETLLDRTASAGTLPVRTHVLDNAPDYLSRFDRTRLQATVDGWLLPEMSAPCSGGQVFRGELPANLLGPVAYRFASTDEHGNTGVSSAQTFTSSYAPPFQISYGPGTSGSAGGEPALAALSVPFPGSTLFLGVRSAAPSGTPAILAVASQLAIPPIEVPGLLLLNLGGNPLVIQTLSLGYGGGGVLALPLGQIPAGVHAYAQAFVLDPTPGGALLASSKGLELITQ